MLSGYSFTLFAVRRAGTVSIAVMELVDNAIIRLHARRVGRSPSDGPFWSAILGGFAVVFLITTPVNKSMSGGGKGNVVVRTYH